MLEKPNIADETIVACLHDEYRLQIASIEFLPLGADRHTAVYRVNANDGTPYFIKLRSGDFDPMSIIVPKYLHDQGIAQIIPPHATHSQTLWADLGDFKLTVSPYNEGRDGYTVTLTDQHWVDLGRVLKQIHTAALPAAITDHLKRETFSDHWYEAVRTFQQSAAETPYPDPVSAQLAAFLIAHKATINNLVNRAEYLAGFLQARPGEFVLCHADIHAANVLIDSDDQLYVVDWDTLILAPKARDLMYVGGGQFVNQRTPDEEAHLFYQGYGPTQADPVGLAYYRYMRIIEDIAVYCEEILLTDGDGEDRANGLRQLTRQFEPGNVVEIAFRSETSLPK